MDDVITGQLEINAPKKNPKPLIINNHKDETVLLKIATWISQSQPIEGGTARFYSRGIGPTTLTVKLRDGREIGLEPAYDCETKQLTNGGSETKCRHSEGHLILSNDNKRIRVTQPELDKWLIQGWNLDV